jgi:putative ABC transport system permease protein
MRIRDIIPLSYKALILNKSRTILTMLGIIIGISSVILMVAVGQAAQRYLLSQIASFGSDLVFVANGKGDNSQGGPPSASIKQTLTQNDYEDLNKLDWPAAVNGSVITNDLVSYGSENLNATINATAPDETKIFSETVTHGRFLDDTDVSGHARVVVLGDNIANRLFGEEDPVGRTMKISKQPFRVIGVMDPAGTKFFTNVDDEVSIPFTTGFDLYKKNRLNFISLKSGNVAPSEAKALIRITLRENHNISNPNNDLAKDDFRVATQEDTIARAGMIGTILQVLLGSIASISLVVAGVGIMNIMYVTVTERTREIGLRKAVGAKSGDILGQFLAEAILLTVLAGTIGIIFGISVSWLAIQIILHFQTGWTFSVPWSGAAAGFGVSAAIGIIFGYFPARRAAKLNPIEALRYE